MTLRTRLTLWYASLLTFIIVLLGTSVFALMWWSMVRQVDDHLQDTAAWIDLNSRLAVLPVASERYQINLPELDFVRASGVEVQVWLADPEGVYHPVDSSANIANYKDPLDAASIGHTDEHIFSTVRLGDAWWRVHTSPVMVSGRFVGSIQVAQSLELMNAATRQLLLVTLGCSVLAVVSSVVMSRWSARRMLEPVEELTQAASRIVGTSDLSTRLTWSGPNDELGRLIGVFNRMMERLQSLFAVQQQFVADVSHELRTPLTGILGNLQIIKKYGADDASLDAVQADGERMSRLVNSLLLLARADAGGMQISPRAIDADELIASAVASMKLTAQSLDVKLVVEHLEPLRLYGDYELLKQALAHLMDNAIKFSTTGQEVTLSIQRIDQSARIEVTDQGVGIEPAHLERIFDRFYQVDSSRTTNGKHGFGLGLSMARWIAEQHQGSLEGRSQPGHGSTFTLTLPLMSAENEVTHPSLRATAQRLPRIRVPEGTTNRSEPKP